MSSAPYVMPSHNWLTESELLFHPEDQTRCHVHPLIGLTQFGPYSQSIISQVLNPVRVGFIVGHGKGPLAMQLLSELEHRAIPRERANYLAEFPGFSRVFNVRVAAGCKGCHVELDKDVDKQIAGSSDPHLVLADVLTKSLSRLEPFRNEFDLIAIILPDHWQCCFKGRESEDFDLHDYLKAVTASRGIPMQLLQEGRAFKYRCRCSVMWRLSIAIYCKAGGIPWKLAGTNPDTAFVGLSYAQRHLDGAGPRFVTCCSQVFDADGTGFEFIAYDVGNVHFERENPYLSRVEMRRLLARSLALYQDRHAGRSPKRVVVHKSTPFKPEEVDGCFDAWPTVNGLELLQIQQDVAWRAVQINPHRNREGKGAPGRYPCRRGR